MEKRELRWAVIRLEYVRRRCLRGYFQTLGIPLGQGQPRVLERLLFQGAMSQRQLSDAWERDARRYDGAFPRY